MEDREEKEVFSYTYSAKEQEEVKNIRKKYAPAEEDKLSLLKQMDADVYRKASMIPIIVGVIGTLFLGVGMCCTMVWQGGLFIPGIVIGIVGIIVISLAYPLYNRTLKREREKIAPEILRLSDELMKK